MSAPYEAPGQLERLERGAPPVWQTARHEKLILESHARCRRSGLEALDRPDFTAACKSDMRQALDENRFLFHHAAPVMEALHEQISNTHSMIVLTASSGMILHSLGDTDFLDRAAQVALTPGVNWSEPYKGTNAVGTALAEGQPVVVHGEQHFLNCNKFLTCSCTPIHDPYGDVVGALDVSGDHRSYHQHTMALVRMSAQLIENHMFADLFPKAVRVHFHSRSEFLGTLVEGIAVFTPEGRFLSANRSAQFQFGLSVNALKAHTFSSLFGLSMSQLLDRSRDESSPPILLCLHNGVSVWVRSRVKLAAPLIGASAQTVRVTPPQASDSAPATESDAQTDDASLAARSPQLSSLRYLDTGDPQVSALIQKLRMVQGRDIPIMILGETGTGKDLLAQAIHNDSNRGGQGFVSVNCASIPESLIESELFGYEEGAFTGAKRKGSVGKILQANGGTLFLDEIGDMPRHLQARLLRVLQERRVSPLGAGKEVEVDVAVICATNKNLKEMIARGEFREDLYYRLNGLVVRLPALRDRTDFEIVVRKIVSSFCTQGGSIDISDDVMRRFREYPWPGNFRQLYNLLHTAAVMVACEGTIELAHLPDDFLEEVNAMPDSLHARHEGGPRVMASEMGHYVPEALVAAPLEAGAQSLEDVAIHAMAAALRQCRGNVSAAAKLLGVSRNTIYRKKAALPADVWK